MNRKRSYLLSLFDGLGLIEFTNRSLKSSTETNTTLRLKLSDAEKTHAEKVRIAREEEWSKIERLEKEKEDVCAQFLGCESTLECTLTVIIASANNQRTTTKTQRFRTSSRDVAKRPCIRAW